jgi:hypothetical protein
MTKPVFPALNNNKWLFGLITLFAAIMLLGFIPWEHLFSIQINNNTIACLTDFPMGLLGLFGLLCTTIICLMRSKKRFSIALSILLGILSIPIACGMILNFIIPTFRWYDKEIYRNANDYLVIQEQETFVTSNLTYPRVIRTTSPYRMIRIVEEQLNLKNYDSRFQGNVITYKGKTWRKEPKKE